MSSDEETEENVNMYGYCMSKQSALPPLDAQDGNDVRVGLRHDEVVYVEQLRQRPAVVSPIHTRANCGE